MKMKRIRPLCALAVLSSVLLAACSTLNREPRTDPEPIAPSQVSDFDTLYSQSCAGCHGAEGRGGAAIVLANPVYLAIVDEATVRNVVANGVHGTSMPAFAQRAGGMLTEQQIEVITSGIFSRWGANKFSMEPTRPHTQPKPWGMSITAKLCLEDIAHPAMVLQAEGRPREAPSRMIHSWRWSAIRDSAQS